MNFFLIFMIPLAHSGNDLFLFSFVLHPALVVPSLEKSCNLGKEMYERGAQFKGGHRRLLSNLHP